MDRYKEARLLDGEGQKIAGDSRQDEAAWPPSSDGGWLESLPGFSNPWQWDELASEIGQESQARVVIAGLAGSGKSLLFNRLRGWIVSWPDANERAPAEPDRLHLEPFGAFILARLPAESNGERLLGEALLLELGDPSLIIYLLDASCGVRPADYRWISTLRAAGRPLVVALNKCDLQAEYETTTAEANLRLGMAVIPISAQTGLNVESRLLPSLLDAAPKVAVPLGREIACLRRLAARRLIRQAALFAGLMGAQPIPLLDLPFQAALQVGVVMRVGAVYGRAPTGGVNREIVSTALSALGFRYLALALIKLVPILGWAVTGAASGATTLLVGEAAIYYYESGETIPLAHYLAQGRGRLRDWRIRWRYWFGRQRSRVRWRQGYKRIGRQGDGDV